MISPAEWLRFYSPSQCRDLVLPEWHVLVGDFHIVRGSTTVIGGPPSVGKSRAITALARVGATREEWFGLPVHVQFKTLILQNENGRHRLKQEFSNVAEDALDKFIRISEPPPFGMAFDRPEFRAELERQCNEFCPAVVAVDPWNSVARDDKQKDYLETFEAIRLALPKGDKVPALVIAAHTKKPQGDVRKTGRSLLHEVAGSHVLASVPRCVFVMQSVSDDPSDDRIIWTCCKNNDGEMGDPSVWHRRDGLFVPADMSEAELQAVANGPKVRPSIEESHLRALFDEGRRTLSKKDAVPELMQLSGCGHSACYEALSSAGKFRHHLRECENGLLSWQS